MQDKTSCRQASLSHDTQKQKEFSDSTCVKLSSLALHIVKYYEQVDSRQAEAAAWVLVLQTSGRLPTLPWIRLTWMTWPQLTNWNFSQWLKKNQKPNKTEQSWSKRTNESFWNTKWSEQSSPVQEWPPWAQSSCPRCEGHWIVHTSPAR